MNKLRIGDRVKALGKTAIVHRIDAGCNRPGMSKALKEITWEDIKYAGKDVVITFNTGDWCYAYDVEPGREIR